MHSIRGIQELVRPLQSVTSLADLKLALGDACARLGCRYFAMTEHLDFGRPSTTGFRLHNYPEAWACRFDRAGLGITDPIHRASQTTLTGFRWRQVPSMIRFSARDRAVLEDARTHGLGGGFTVPANVPGETLGSCSFAGGPGEDLAEDVLPIAHLAGQFAFEAARRISGARPSEDGPELTNRQLECVMWFGRGKTDWEIARILGVSHATVVEHLRHARERYDAPARAMLPVRALFDGALSFADILVRRHPQSLE